MKSLKRSLFKKAIFFINRTVGADTILQVIIKILNNLFIFFLIKDTFY